MSLVVRGSKKKKKQETKTVIYHQDAKDINIIWNAKPEDKYLSLDVFEDTWNSRFWKHLLNISPKPTKPAAVWSIHIFPTPPGKLQIVQPCL